MHRSIDIAVPKTIVLIGMMGVGKTSIGRRLAKKLGMKFTDSDQEVENAAKCSISDIFEIYGETAFHDIERRVIKRLLDESIHVLATGGSAFSDEETKKLIKENGISIWLAADLETLLPRIERRDHRPQFAESKDIRKTLESLIEVYSPLYAEADIRIDCNNRTPDQTTDQIILELNRHISKLQSSSGKQIHHG